MHKRRRRIRPIRLAVLRHPRHQRAVAELMREQRELRRQITRIREQIAFYRSLSEHGGPHGN